MNAEELKRFALLMEFDDADRIGLCELLVPLSLGEGETLFREGDQADALYLVGRGSIRIKRAGCGELGLLSDGSSLGALSLMTIGSREASACAESQCDLLVLSRADFLRLAEDTPRTACRLAQAVVVELAAGLRPQLARVGRESSARDGLVSA